MRVSLGKYILIYFFCFSTAFQVIYSQTNEGTDFWFGFMEHFDVGQNTMVAMITSKQNTNGLIEMPGQEWSQNFSVLANDVVIIRLPGSAENLGSEMIQDLGIHVTSQQPVSVYIHQYHGMRSEATVVLPQESIGHSYYVMSYTGVLIQNEPYESEFLLVGTEDETLINITLSATSARGKAAGSTFTIELDQGETYQVQARNHFDDLTGTQIVADKKIAVFGGNDWTEVPTGCSFRDNLLEQMYSIDTWGKKFVTVPNDKVSYDIFRILGSEDDTNVLVSTTTGDTPYNIDAGTFVEFRNGLPSFIEADKPVLVAQYNVGSSCSGHFLGDPSMVLLNSVEQTRDTVTLYNSSFENISENFINIITQTNDIEAVVFDGTRLVDAGFEFLPVGADERFSFVRLSVSVGAHTISSEGCGVIATAYGYGDVESYAYSGGASFSSINASPIPDGGCLNDTIVFDPGLSPFRYSFDWDLGDGTKRTDARFMHVYDSLGSYPVEVIIVDECLNTVDTLKKDLFVTLRQAIDADGGRAVCEGESIQLSATDLAGATYAWNGPNNYFSEVQFPLLANISNRFTGTYEVVGSVSGCATFPSFLDVEVIDKPIPNLGPDTIFCAQYGFSFNLEPGSFSSYQWQDNQSIPIYPVTNPGTYSISVTNDFGCIGIDEVTLEEVCPTIALFPNAFSPNGDGINDFFGIEGSDIINMTLWIYDRWGNLIFESHTIENQWDGRWKNVEASTGVYVWVAEVEGYEEDGTISKNTLSGSLTLIR